MHEECPGRNITGPYAALAQVALARMRGWLAVARVIGPCDETFRHWALQDAYEEIEQALTWHQGSAPAFGADLYALRFWAEGPGQRADERQWQRIRAAARPDPQLGEVIAQVVEVTAEETRAWDEGDMDLARFLRSQADAPIHEAAQLLATREIPSGLPQPYRALERLIAVFVGAETNQPLHLRPGAGQRPGAEQL